MDVPYEPLSESSWCLSQHVTYEHRVDDTNHYNFCLVPGSGADAVLYMAIAVLVGCVVSGKLSSVWILVAGAVMEAFAYHFNLRQLSNASAMWMGMNPPDIFLYIFLPPLLLDSAARIEFFMFRKVAVQSVAFAVLAVVGMAAIMTPLMLYAFDLQAMGWHWSHAALFTCMIASTDAVAVTAVLKKANGPETLAVLMEGESLFNDATSIVLFELMLEKVKEYERGETDDQALVGELARTMRSMALLAAGGALCGLLAGSITTRLMKLLRVRGMPPEFEVGITFGMGYLVFYLANAPLHLSGVIAVVVYGLYGSATLKWEMSAVASREHFRRFWDVLSQLTNTVVFFFSGAACYNFFIRSLVALESDGHSKAVAVTFWRLPIIFVFVMIVRLLLIMLFAPALGIFGYSMDWRGVVLCTVGGMRGSLCLIMVQTVVLDMGNPGSVRDPDQMSAVKSALVMWTAGVVMCTLLINAPALPFVLRVTGLTKVSLLTLQSRDKSRQQFLKFTYDCITGMQQSADERMQGVDWHQVKQLVDCTHELKELVAPGDTADLFADIADRQDVAYGSDAISESGHGNEPGLRYPSISHPPIAQDGKTLKKLSSAYSSHGPGASTSFFTRSSIVFPVPQTELQDSFPRDAAPAVTADALKRSATLQSAPTLQSAITLPSAESADDPLLQATRSGAPQLEDPSRASVQLDGLPVRQVATMDEASRKKLLSQLDNKIKESMGEGASFVLQKKAAPEPACNDTASTAGEESICVPLLSNLEGPSGSRGSDREPAHVADHRQPCILLMDPLQGFVLTSTSRDSHGHQHSRVSYSHSGRPADARAYLRTSSSRHSVTSFNSKLRGEGSITSGPLSEDLALHQLAALPAGALQRLHEEMVAEHRMRMIAGMKRYFHRKRNEGSLSNQGLRTLDHACDTCMDHPELPIDIFGHLQAEFSPGMFMFLVSNMHFRLRKLLMCLLCIWPWCIRVLVSWPVQLMSRMLSTTLSNRLLLALEVAIEYWLALAFSIESKSSNGEINDGPQEAHVQQVLQAEMEEQRAQVWQYINDRHMEAPDRFRAIQTYRAAMAIIAQQRQLIVRMYNTAVLTENEQEIMVEAVDARERALREKGAAWEPPSTSESLRNLPLFADLPDALFQEVILEGRMIKYREGAIIEPTSGSLKNSADSAFVGVILSGLATTKVEPCMSLAPGLAFGSSGVPAEESSVYLTHGTIFGLSSVLAYKTLPGHGDIVASSKSQATHVFEIPKQVFEAMESRARSGSVECTNFMLTLHRLFAIQIIERLHELFIASVGNTLCALGHVPLVPPGESDSLTSIPGSVESKPPRGQGSRWRGRPSAFGSPAGGNTVPQSAVQCMWIAVRSLLQQAQLRVLEAGAHELLHSSAVLLSGSLEAASKSDVDAKRPKRLPCTATAPCALVWAPSRNSPGEGALEVFAGGEGAILVVCDAAQELALRRYLQKAEATQNEV